MPKGVGVSGTRATSITEAEYTVDHEPRHHRASTRTRRLVFFTMASLWGFTIGVAGLLAAMSAAGQPVQPSPGAIAGLIPAFVVAVAGAFVMVAAYKESRRHSR